MFIALGHPLRRRILRKMLQEDRELSPRELSSSLSESLSALSYHVRVLAECRAVKLVRVKPIRGSSQHFYRPTVKAEWARSALEETEARPKRRARSKKNRARGEEKG
jgi:DNA-binding transcriptional ArsR family regulator